MIASEFIQARKSQLKFYKGVELFAKVEGQGFVLYKKSGISLSDMRLDHGTHPETLFIKQRDKLKGLQEAQKGFNRDLEHFVTSDDPVKVKEAVVNVVEETLTEPRSGSLEGISDTVDILVGDCVRHSRVIENLIDISYQDYSTVLHSINVMAFALGFASHMNYSREKSKSLGLGALLHDVGKTKINPKLLVAPRKLTDEEFQQVEKHTTIGYDILKACRFSHKDISLVALEHHEKLDGSGYPNGKTKISQSAQIVGIIDCYEALTNNERPYRKAMAAFNTLSSIIGNEVRAGKYNGEFYCYFVRSLGMLSRKSISAPPPPVDTEGNQIASAF